MSSNLRSRSRSPYREEKLSERSTRHRPHSPHRSNHAIGQTKRNHRHISTNTNTSLPFGAGVISKHDLRSYRPMFGLYLDIQKHRDIDDLPEDEVRGRWKSFVGKWNRGELAEGWYDPNTLSKAIAAQQQEQEQEQERGDEYTNRKYNSDGIHAGSSQDAESEDVNPKESKAENDDDNDNDEDDFGPAMPPDAVATIIVRSDHSRQGPGIPTLQDIQARNEQAREDAETTRSENVATLRASRKADRRLQTSRLDDLTPRAEAGSRERMLEKKRLKTESNRSFAASAQAGGDVELRDADIMGGDEDSLAHLKRVQKEKERKKNEREIRKEDILRARMAEREEKMKGLREKENKTMDMLKKIAEARFGGGEGAGSRD